MVDGTVERGRVEVLEPVAPPHLRQPELTLGVGRIERHHLLEPLPGALQEPALVVGARQQQGEIGALGRQQRRLLQLAQREPPRVHVVAGELVLGVVIEGLGARGVAGRVGGGRRHGEREHDEDDSQRDDSCARWEREYPRPRAPASKLLRTKRGIPAARRGNRRDDGDRPPGACAAAAPPRRRRTPLPPA